MKSETPQISWHNREPVLSCDVQFYDNDKKSLRYRIATSSFDHHVIIWLATLNDCNGAVKTDVLADLNRHSKPVNVVRFSPSPGFLASGDNDGIIIVWKLHECIEDKDISSGNLDDAIDDYGIVNKEHWIQYKILRGHLEDVVDISWFCSGQFLVSASVDNHAFIWDVTKVVRVSLEGHKSYVQGVAYDPLDSYIVTLSADRSLRIFDSVRKRTLYRVHKENIFFNGGSKSSRLFYDDTLRSFCRRICFSPNGEFLLASSGIVEIFNEDSELKFINCCYLFMRNSLNKPAAYFSTGNKYNIAVTCSPVLFELRENVSNPFPFPYRIVFAVATQDSILFFDTQQDIPFAVVADVHYTSLSDIRWSPDGRMLFVSSTDGYCTFITFDNNEIGDIYNGEIYKFETKSIVSSPNQDKESIKSCVTPESTKIRKTPESAKITNFFSKIPSKKNEDSSKSSHPGCKRKVVIELSDDDKTPKKKQQHKTTDVFTLVVPVQKDLNEVCENEAKSTNQLEITNVAPNIQTSMNSLNINGMSNAEVKNETKEPSNSQAKKPRRVNFITLTTPKNN